MTHLSKKVHAFNEAQRIGHKHAVKAIKELRPHIGQKITKTDYTLLNKIKFGFDEIPAKYNEDFPKDYVKSHRVMLAISQYSLWLRFTICAKDTDCTCFYTEYSCFLGNMNGQDLESLTELSQVKRTTVKRQMYLKAEIDKLEDKTRTYKSELI